MHALNYFLEWTFLFDIFFLGHGVTILVTLFLFLGAFLEGPKGFFLRRERFLFLMRVSDMHFHWLQGLWSITCLMKDTWNFVFETWCSSFFHLNLPTPEKSGVHRTTIRHQAMLDPRVAKFGSGSPAVVPKRVAGLL